MYIYGSSVLWFKLPYINWFKLSVVFLLSPMFPFGFRYLSTGTDWLAYISYTERISWIPEDNTSFIAVFICCSRHLRCFRFTCDLLVTERDWNCILNFSCITDFTDTRVQHFNNHLLLPKCIISLYFFIFILLLPP